MLQLSLACVLLPVTHQVRGLGSLRLSHCREGTERAAWTQVVDRPTQGHRFLSREYVQPQVRMSYELS